MQRARPLFLEIVPSTTIVDEPIMQSATWYLRRLGTMSPAEWAWRLHHAVRTALDRPLWGAVRRLTDADRVLTGGSAITTSCANAIGFDPVSRGVPGEDPVGRAEHEDVMRRARASMEHRFTFFDLTDVPLGDPIQWNTEPKANRRTPLVFAADVDYRDTRVTGDCKFAWEANRHAHLVSLGQAYHLTGEERYAREAIAQIESWIDQCPFGFGMNWRSPLELAIRLINWVWTLGLIAPSGLPAPSQSRRIHECAYRHLWDISRKYSKYSSANNHLIGEAAGVWIGATAFRPFRGAERMRRRARDILLLEVDRQTHSDGGNREQAFSYHLFVLEFLLLSGLVARNVGEDFPQRYWQVIARMSRFLDELRAAGAPPMYGDADDGYVLGIGGPFDLAPRLSLACAKLVGAGTPADRDAALADRSYWIMRSGSSKRALQTESGDVDATSRLRSTCFPSTGLYLLQGERLDIGLCLSATLDGGELGMGTLAAHGHADALSVTLRINGRTILCDPGTYDYFTYPEWRTYFRRTRAHNTIEFDGADQSEMLGPFMWGRRPRCRLLHWRPSDDGGEVSFELGTDGQEGLRTRHRRLVRLSMAARSLVIVDELGGLGKREARQFWHLGMGCEIRSEPDNVLGVEGEGAHVRIRLDRALKLTLHRGESDPIFGWFSAGYHRKTPITTVEGLMVFSGSAVLTTQLEF